MDSSIYRLKLGDILAVCVLGLLFLGILMVQSAAMNIGMRWLVKGERTDTQEKVERVVEAMSAASADKKARELGIEPAGIEPAAAAVWQWNERGRKHLMFVAVAIVVFFLAGQIDYDRFRRGRNWYKPIIVLTALAVLTCIGVLVPGVGRAVNGARRWISLGFVQFQPSDLAKWGAVFFLAWWLTLPQVNLRSFFKGFVPALAPIGVLCLLVVIQDFGTAALIGLCAIVMLMISRVRWWHIAMVIPPALAAGAWFIMHKEYRWRRMTAFIDPYASPRTEGYHMIQSLLSFSSGGLTGRGLGNGVQKLGYLPEDTTDFIFAVICEELGLFGALLTVALYAGLLYVAWQVIKQRRDSFGRMLAFGIGAMIGLQALINIAVATVSVPTKGLSLPLVSAGGSGLVITCGALGVLLSISRHPHADEIADLKFEIPDVISPSAVPA